MRAGGRRPHDSTTTALAMPGFLAVTSPGYESPDYFREVHSVLAASAGGPPDLAEIGEVMRRPGSPPPRPPPGETLAASCSRDGCGALPLNLAGRRPPARPLRVGRPHREASPTPRRRRAAAALREAAAVRHCVANHQPVRMGGARLERAFLLVRRGLCCGLLPFVAQGARRDDWARRNCCALLRFAASKPASTRGRSTPPGKRSGLGSRFKGR